MNCVSCKLEIADGATRCPHCHGQQGDLANPLSLKFVARFWVPLFLFCFLIAIPIVFYKSEFRQWLKTSDERSSRPEPKLSVVVDSLFTSPGSDHPIVGAIGTITNSSATTWEAPRVEAVFLDSAGHQIDVIAERLSGVVVAPHSSSRFRIMDVAASPIQNYAKCQVRVVWATRVP